MNDKTDNWMGYGVEIQAGNLKWSTADVDEERKKLPRCEVGDWDTNEHGVPKLGFGPIGIVLDDIADATGGHFEGKSVREEPQTMSSPPRSKIKSD